ncbi:septum formation protein Maf [bacterium]|nr:MAG: septum formation protein Maf [bacterium]
MTLPKFYLASHSPRRQEILQRVGIDFDIVPRKPVDETIVSHDSPSQFAETLARLKARNAILTDDTLDGIVLGFDTIVYIDGEILGKPKNEVDAKKYLRKLSGKWHTVHTGVAAIRISSGEIKSSCETTEVLFSNLTDDEIDAYILSNEPMDKAGAYGIQEFGALLVEKIDGCFYNVVGLPLLCLTKVLKMLNIDRIEFLRRKF